MPKSRTDKLTEAFIACAVIISIAVLAGVSHFFGDNAGGVAMFVSIGIFALIYLIRFVLFPFPPDLDLPEEKNESSDS